MGNRSGDSGTSFHDLALEVEDMVGDEIADGLRHGKREDTITENIVSGLREVLRERLVHSPCKSYNLVCEAYKFSGQLEHDHGDVGFMIRRSDGSGDVLEGWGYIEAKLRYPQSGRFEAFDLEQIDRIRAKSPYALILPYDYELPLPEFPDMMLPYECPCEEFRIWEGGTPVIPISLVANQKGLSRDLYRVSLPIGHQIIHRFVRGFDLDYVGPPDGIVERFRRKHPSPWVIVITVSEENEEVVESTFDVEGYRPLGESVGGSTESTAHEDLSYGKRLDDNREEGLGFATA